MMFPAITLMTDIEMDDNQSVTNKQGFKNEQPNEAFNELNYWSENIQNNSTQEVEVEMIDEYLKDQK
jgi:hypothetical protein